MSLWYNAHLILIQAIFTSTLVALSIQVPLRIGVFTFSGVGAYGIAGYTAAIMTTKHNWGASASIGLGMLVATVSCVLLGLLVGRLSGLYLGMATIAFDLILGVIVTNGGDFTGGATGLYGAINDISMTQIVGCTVVIIAVLVISERGRMGRRITAVRADPELAASVGINVRRHRLMAFAASGLIGGCAGGLDILIRTQIAPTDIGLPLVITTLTMIIVGGARSWLGAAIGATLFTWLPNLLQVISEWQAIIYGVVVALAAVWVPGGLVGAATDGYRALLRRRRARTRGTTGDAPFPPERGQLLPSAELGSS